MRLTAPCRSMLTAMPTARYVLPVPAGPMAGTTPFLFMASTQRERPSVRGRTHGRRKNNRIDDIEHAAETGDRGGCALRLEIALEQRFGQVAEHPCETDR